MKPDNRISRLVRPAILIWLTFVFTCILVIDGNFFNIVVKEAYISVLESILVVVYMAYFIPKSAEHITRIYKDSSKDV